MEHIRGEGRHEDTRAIVTGSGSGIGRATALRLASEGARVACLDVKGHDATAAEIVAAGGHAWDYECNVTDAGAVARAVDLAFSELGGLSRGVQRRRHRPVLSDRDPRALPCSTTSSR